MNRPRSIVKNRQERRALPRFLEYRRVLLALAIAGIVILAVAAGPGATGEEEATWPEPNDYATRRVLGLQAWDSTCGMGEQNKPDPGIKLKTSASIWAFLSKSIPKLPDGSYDVDKWKKRLSDYITNDYFDGYSRVGIVPFTENSYEESFKYGDFFVSTGLLLSESRAMGSSGKRFDKFDRILNSLGEYGFFGTKVTTTIRVPDGYECYDNSGWLKWSGTRDGSPDSSGFPFVPALEPDGETIVDWSGGIPTPEEVDEDYKDKVHPLTLEPYDCGPYKARITELVKATIYRGAGMEFYREYFRALSNSDKKEADQSSRGYGSAIGYYEPAEEPGRGFNLIERQYDADYLASTGEFKLANYWGPQYAWIHFYGWPTIDYPRLQQVAYDEIKENDPGGKSCVISGDLYDDQAYLPVHHESGLHENWDSYNRALDDNGRPGQAVSARIESNVPVLCERPMYFNYSDRIPGGHCTFGVVEPETEWYFAEGCTLEGFEEYLCIQNPNPATETATVTVEYMTENGVITRGHEVAGNSRNTITVHDSGQAGPDKNVSVKVTSNIPIICERPMYFNNKGKYRGGHIVAGANAPQDEWYFAEGCTREGFETWLCIQNPQVNAATVDIVYMLDGGETISKQETVDATSRKTVKVNNHVPPGRDVSIKVTSNQAIVCERPVYFEYPGRGNVPGCNGGHNTLGATGPAKNWYFAEGCTRHEAGQGKFETWLCLQNPSKEQTIAKITCMNEEGTVIEHDRNLPAHSRVTLFIETDIVDDVTGSTVGPQRDVSIQVQAGHPIVCERPVYFKNNRKLRALRYGGGNWRRDVQGRLSNAFDIEKDNGAKVAAANACLNMEEEWQYTEQEIMGLIGTTPEEEKRVNYHWEFYDESVSGGHNVMGSVQGGATKWYFAEGAVGSMWPGLEVKDCTGNVFEEYICIMNPNAQEAEVRLYVQTEEGQEIRGRRDTGTTIYKIPGKSRKTIKLNTELSFGKSCDAIGVHLFGRPGDWEYAYDSLKRLLNEFVRNGNSAYTNKELVVSSCGWPHGDPLPNEEGVIVPTERGTSTYENQLMSIEEIEDLMSHNASEPPDEHGRTDPPSFCDKVWVYKDVDEQVAKDAYFGYFSYHETDPVPLEVGNTTLWAEIKKQLDALTSPKTLPANRFTVKTVEEYLKEYGIIK